MRFPYNVNKRYIALNDNKCCYDVADRTGFHFYRCTSPVKKIIDGVGFCKKHANGIKKWRGKTNGNKPEP